MFTKGANMTTIVIEFANIVTLLTQKEVDVNNQIKHVFIEINRLEDQFNCAISLAQCYLGGIERKNVNRGKKETVAKNSTYVSYSY